VVLALPSQISTKAGVSALHHNFGTVAQVALGQQIPALKGAKETGRSYLASFRMASVVLGAMVNSTKVESTAGATVTVVTTKTQTIGGTMEKITADREDRILKTYRPGATLSHQAFLF
jgi:hypothetical protein